MARLLFVRVQGLVEKSTDLMAAANWTVPLAPVQGINSPFGVALGLAVFDDKAPAVENSRAGILSKRFPASHAKYACFGTGLKIYVHNTGRFERGGLFCSAGQWGVEVILHRYFLRSSCRVYDPNDADLFLVPDYRACHVHLKPRPGGTSGLTTNGKDDWSVIIGNHSDKVRSIDQMNQTFGELLGSLEPWYSRNNGMDHVFIWSDQGFVVNFTHTYPEWRENIYHSIFLTTEAHTPGCGQSCFSPWKDFTIPGHLDRFRVEMVQNKNKATRERTLLFNFHGRMPSNHAYYSKVFVRGAIEHYFKNKPNVSVGDFVPNYFEIMGNSHFCLIPYGTSSWTNTLYTSFHAGCIPVILSDHFVLPFQDHIDWHDITIRWPEHGDYEQLYDMLWSFANEHIDEVERIKSKLDRFRCWFNWYDFDRVTECSPYKAVALDLEKRVMGWNKYKSRFGWFGDKGDWAKMYKRKET